MISDWDLWKLVEWLLRQLLKNTTFEQRLLIQRLIIFDYSFGPHCYRMYNFRVCFRISYNSILESQSCRYDPLLFIQNRLRHFFMLEIEFQFRSNRYCIHLELTKKGQCMISRPMIIGKSFFALQWSSFLQFLLSWI